VVADSLDLNLQAADVANKNQFTPSGDDLVIVQNSHASTAYTFTLTSAPDPFNRTGDITTYSLAAGEVAVFRIKTLGWAQVADGKVYLEGSNAAVKFAVVPLQ
jgi:hypothetical protein